MKKILKIAALLLVFALLFTGCAQDGKSAYEIAVEYGFEGTELEWLESLKGADGKDGKDGIDGKDGRDGVDGVDGINGVDGIDGMNGANGEDGSDGKNGRDGRDGADGKDGMDGKNGLSAYEIALQHGYTGTIEEFVALLLGTGSEVSPEEGGAAVEGETEIEEGSGAYIPVPGKSAYEIALDHGFIGTEEEWLETLKAVATEELIASEYGIYPGEVDMNAMQNLLLLASEYNNTIRFSDGIYYFPSTIDVYSNTSLCGNTNTIFSISSESTSDILMNIGSEVDNIYISHINFKGDYSDTPSAKGSKIGLKVSGAGKINIENVEFFGFDGYGFYAEKMSSNSFGEFYKMLQITNCRFYNNYYGMCLGPRCEYTQVLNCVFGNNQIGCLNQGGNNSYSSCIFNVNNIGFQMDSKNLSNPAHGGCYGSVFNHNTKPIVINDCTIGWVFSGFQIFYGNIELNESNGVVFTGGIFGSCKLISKHSSMRNANIISDSFFQTDSAAILAENDGSTYVTNCLPNHIVSQNNPELSWIKLAHSIPSTYASAAASENAYFGAINTVVSENSRIDILEIAICGANSENQNIKGVDVWIGNAQTGEVTEKLLTDAELKTVFSSNLNTYVLRIEIEKTYDYPVFFVIEATRTSGRGIAYGRSDSATNFFSGESVNIGDILSANNSYTPIFAVFSIPQE